MYQGLESSLISYIYSQYLYDADIEFVRYGRHFITNCNNSGSGVDDDYLVKMLESMGSQFQEFLELYRIDYCTNMYGDQCGASAVFELESIPPKSKLRFEKLYSDCCVIYNYIWECLHAMQWNRVQIEYKYIYSYISLVKVVCTIMGVVVNRSCGPEWQQRFTLWGDVGARDQCLSFLKHEIGCVDVGNLIKIADVGLLLSNACIKVIEWENNDRNSARSSTEYLIYSPELQLPPSADVGSGANLVASRYGLHKIVEFIGLVDGSISGHANRKRNAGGLIESSSPTAGAGGREGSATSEKCSSNSSPHPDILKYPSVSNYERSNEGECGKSMKAVGQTRVSIPTCKLTGVNLSLSVESLNDSCVDASSCSFSERYDVTPSNETMTSCPGATSARVCDIDRVTCAELSLNSFLHDYMMWDSGYRSVRDMHNGCVAHSGRAVVLLNCIDDWPALSPVALEEQPKKCRKVESGCISKNNLSRRYWGDLDYLKSVAGHRVVPVETGTSYLSEDSGQKLQSVRDFIESYLEPDDRKQQEETKKLGYLAQHTLFEQIPQLRKDIFVPDYCCMLTPDDENIPENGNFSNNHSGNSDPGAVLEQAWLGPVGTISPLHHDPYHNILAQVVGYKYVRLYENYDAHNQKMHAFGSNELGEMELGATHANSNNSRIDLHKLCRGCNVGESGNSCNTVDCVDYQTCVHVPCLYHAETERIPPMAPYYNLDSCSGEVMGSTSESKPSATASLRGCQYREVMLAPGECLYIPRHMWHYVMSVDREFALKWRENRYGTSANAPRDVNANSNPPVDFSFSVSFWWGKRIEQV